MTSDLLRLLEFDKIREMLASHCDFVVAAERARQLVPTADPEQVRYLLQVTREASQLLREHPSFHVGGLRDVRPLVAAVRRGSILSPGELRTVLDTLEAAQQLRWRFLEQESWHERFPALSEFVVSMTVPPGLLTELARSIGPRGEVLDTASPELARIRRELKVAHEQLMERVRRLLLTYRDALQEEYATIREGRYVIPVRSDRRSAVAGISHDVSGSGHTVFVEPLELIELNNRWRELQAAEQHEIERILRVLSREIADEGDTLLRLVEAGAALDVALAKARLAQAWDAVEPEILEGTGRAVDGGHPWLRVRLRRARHPLLDPTTAVPIDLELGERYRILVITGPNTGGKTVALKTVGLFVLMMQAGLFLPAAPGTGASVFPAIFVDIGDEQSIEQNLSTFSSHLKRIVLTLQQADERSLVLLDELAAGTDPHEGAALARAILEELLALGVLGVVTTHYPELKAIAAGLPGLENASVEFDPVSLRPTYRLLVGLPGRSHALQIARRLGLPPRVVERAERYLGSGSPQLDQLIAGMQKRLEEAEVAAREATRLREEAQRLRSEAERLLREAEQERANVRAQAIAELEEELHRARQIARRLQRLAEREPYPPPEVVEASVRALEEARRRIGSQKAEEKAFSVPPVAVGDRVELPALGLEGEVVALHRETEEVEVQVGGFRVRQPLAAVRPTGTRVAGSQAPRAVTVRASRPPAVEPELHLRGLYVEEALERLDRYLDQAVRAGLPRVRIVHGKGTGVLRQAVHEFLRHHPLVERWELASPFEGGAGVTIVYLQG